MSVYSGHSVERHIVPYQFEIEKVIDTKLEKLPSHSNIIISNRQIDNYQPILADVDKIIEMNKDTANDLTIPANNTIEFPIGIQIGIHQYGIGQTTIVAAEGVTIRSAGGLRMATQYSSATIRKVGTDEWVLAGDTIV